MAGAGLLSTSREIGVCEGIVNAVIFVIVQIIMHQPQMGACTLVRLGCKRMTLPGVVARHTRSSADW